MEAKAAPTITYYDDAERSRIRQAMRRYLSQNRIGSPKLRDLIADANGLSQRKDGADPIALSTVQRFIVGKHRVNDGFVRLCANFVAGLPDADPIAAFGEQLMAFLGVSHGEGLPGMPSDLAGSYACHAKRALPTGQNLRLLPKDNPKDLVPFSRITIDLLPDCPFAAIRETVENWDAVAPGKPDPRLTTPPRRAYEGVVACPDGTLFALMRNVTSGTPRIYWLARTTGNWLGGYGHESISNLDSGDGIERAAHTTTQIVLAPMKEAS